MDSIRVPSPVPSDGYLPSSYSLTGSLPGSGSVAPTSYSAAQHRQMAQVLEIGEEGEAFPELDEEEEGSKQPLPPARGKRRAAQGINVAMKYVELEDGTTIDGFRAAEIRRYARSLWVKMAMDNKLPATWSDADAASLTYYSESMAQRFMEMRLCASDWKANLVATDNYPSWRHNWLKKKTKEGKRPSDAHVEDDSVPMKKPKVLYDDENGPFPQMLSDIPKPNGTSTNNSYNSGNPVETSAYTNGPSKSKQHVEQEGDHKLSLQPVPSYNLNFMIGNPLATPQQHQPGELNTPQDHVPVPTLAINGPKRSKGTRMRPTKNSTTARNICAQDWVKQHPHGTTDEFKSYYDNLSEEQRQVWEDKSKAVSQSQ
ncbi:hypothetical protein HYPSUDRAFT_198479 [Hypholoma sublateritium FD-334 SS-4]|uniref:Uncharacterized protein n=1 Tax=Hypholoma sublateritium (strain FD-334 SS-4) TaxID=945553 RepID=A0A0D2Q6F7_HYPSF|nr:hypothetical protein HYPSUDRAFT_198479 [Hypholoma sublateritium FD-334 SS-4]